MRKKKTRKNVNEPCFLPTQLSIGWLATEDLSDFWPLPAPASGFPEQRALPKDKTVIQGPPQPLTSGFLPVSLPLPSSSLLPSPCPSPPPAAPIVGASKQTGCAAAGCVVCSPGPAFHHEQSTGRHGRFILLGRDFLWGHFANDPSSAPDTTYSPSPQQPLPGTDIYERAGVHPNTAAGTAGRGRCWLPSQPRILPNQGGAGRTQDLRQPCESPKHTPAFPARPRTDHAS